MFASLCACGEENKTEATDAPTVATMATEEVYIPTAFDFGKTYNTSYINRTLGIGLSLHEEWKLSTTAELAKRNGLDEALMVKDLPAAMGDKETACILSATGDEDSAVEIFVENISLTVGSDLTGEEYFEAKHDAIHEELEKIGAENVMMAPTSATIAHNAHDAIVIGYYIGEDPYLQYRIAFPEGDYMGIMVIKGEDDPILARIYSLN